MARRGIACDADSEDVRALPGRPANPGRQDREREFLPRHGAPRHRLRCRLRGRPGFARASG